MLTQFKQLLTHYTGLALSETDHDKAYKFLQSRLAELKTPDLAGYVQQLTANSLRADQEWQLVVQALTVPESFFLRDKGQMHILQQHILPELIQRNRHQRQLRIWSAGCSTGEEPYSLAMLVQKLLPDAHEWDVLILGSDINDKVLAKARAGLYSRWSLRDVGPEVLAYFQPAQQGLLALDPDLREKVTFRRVNLLQTPFPDLEINKIDLILCRNVFIYFDQAAIAAVVEKFVQTLNPEGFLLTGHGELYQQPLYGLQTRLYLESVVYQRSAQSSSRSPAALPDLPRPAAVPTLTAPDIAKARIAALDQAYQAGDYAQVLAIAQTLLSQQNDFDAHYWSAKAFASLGQYPAAEARLHAALALNKRSAACYYLLAHIREAQGDSQQATELLNKAIIADEQFIPAYLELAALYEYDEPLKCQQMRGQALNLLQKLPPKQYLEEFAAHAQDLILHLQ
ncbi:CheR family methyltransferase [Methylovulum psychrotolerans]|uniref:protein-glutamate O-methyltransferase n=1 Tax=Methylovulum psychrotolerans TaxID=1704499 RepID=A0A1Z4C373_9GAMM|nr:CheR family methyltransferase [Methylovulum psychrotolerans]ASF47987.1 hypothetical protein CEK71_19010 [Methylovulum psychrotolerans]